MEAKSESTNEIFISYVHEDHAIAAGIGNFLRTYGCKDVFFTGNDWLLYGGELWLERIREELTAAKVVLCLFSPNSEDRPWVHFEAGAAWLTNKVVIPVCIRGVTVEHLKIPYAGIQGITLADYGSAYYLLRSIHRHLKGGVVPPFSRDCPAWLKLQSALKTEPLDGESL